MHVRKKMAVASAVAIGGGGALLGVPAASMAAGGAADTDISVVAQGLDDPFGLNKAVGHAGFIVAENGSGEVSRVFPDGRTQVVQDRLGVASAAGGYRWVYAVTAGDPKKGARVGVSRVVRMDYHGGHVKVIANLLRYELDHNPDGQKQFVNGHPVDALSNPFALTWSKFGLFVADGGANDVLRVDPSTGATSTFFAPRTFKDTPECKDAPNNPGTTGCDPVATGVEVVGDSVYASFLGAEAPGAGRVYKLDARTGKVQQVWKGLTAPTGVTARKDGTVYTSHVLEGAPEGDGPPPPDFDPSTVGEITRIKDGVRTHAQVTMPTDMVIKRGKLYSTAWSVGSFLGLQHAGQVVKVKGSAFE